VTLQPLSSPSSLPLFRRITWSDWFVQNHREIGRPIATRRDRRSEHLQPPSSPLSGSHPRRRPCTRTRHDLLHLVLTSPSSRSHRSIAGVRPLRARRRRSTGDLTLGEDLLQN
jgi:hypothetical protein